VPEDCWQLRSSVEQSTLTSTDTQPGPLNTSALLLLFLFFPPVCISLSLSLSLSLCLCVSSVVGSREFELVNNAVMDECRDTNEAICVGPRSRRVSGGRSSCSTCLESGLSCCGFCLLHISHLMVTPTAQKKESKTALLPLLYKPKLSDHTFMIEAI
jgi:hypothetical protein